MEEAEDEESQQLDASVDAEGVSGAPRAQKMPRTPPSVPSPTSPPLSRRKPVSSSSSTREIRFRFQKITTIFCVVKFTFYCSSVADL